MVDKWVLGLFNRATYSRMKAFLDYCKDRKDIDLTIILGSTMLDEEYGEAGKELMQEYKDYEYICLPYKSYKSEKNRVNLISADILKHTGEYLLQIGPKVAIAVADRFETLPFVTAAAYLNIPVAHVQGGEVSGNIDDKIRNACTKMADYHFVTTDMSLKYVEAMGEERSRIFNPGCTAIEYVKKNRIFKWDDKNLYFVCMFHPDTKNLKDQLVQTEALLKSVVDFCFHKNCKCIWYWPNADRGREDIINLLRDWFEKYPYYLVKAINKKPFEFLRQMAGSRFIVGNSSAAIREASFIGVPAINIGHRQDVRERSWNVLDIPEPEYDLLIDAYNHQWTKKRYKRSNLFGSGDASRKIVSVLQRTNFELKGPITYPFNILYRDGHNAERDYYKLESKYKMGYTRAK